MKPKLLLLALVLSFAWPSIAQENKAYPALVTTLDSTLATLYGVISGEKGEARDWELFKYLFHPKGQLIYSVKTKSGAHALTYMSPQDYIERSGPWLVENGFFEVEVARKEDHFGNICQVFSTYESYRSKTDDKPFMRGINSIQLQFDGTRWWIVNIYWTPETPDNPIPQQYLKTN
ncbi:hypothetical protein [Gilvibacter sp.]|uniref:hypothetical protein n=1 Tax=Gilvibacter sp. TaxID=2729997 RepID=UPI0035BE1632